MSGLYIHIPFCVRKCSYCAFYSVVSESRKQQELFFETLGKELRSLSTDFLPETLFIGGGTPTAPDTQILESFFPSLEKFHPVEFSVEANPGTVDAAKLDLLKRSGVNRLSIGVQSFDFQCLKTLGRIHTAEQAEEAFRLARAAGFENISVDLMFGIPGQTLGMLESDLERALALNPEHIAIYNLMYEEGTPMDARLDRLDESLERDMYDRIRARLKTAGFVHYEISNFAKPRFECRHNLLYWSGGEYIGCGPAAHSHWKGVRWANVSDLDDYCATGPCHEFEEKLDPEAKERETLVMGLRQIAGIEVSPSQWNSMQGSFQALEKQGLLVINGRRIRLADESLFVSDAVFAELV
jgi:oxygen-independent coproporphyrinogen III oxidase